MTPVAILLLAAGASSRMKGRDKLTEKIGETPLLERQAERATKVAPTWVTLPSLDHPRAALIGSAKPVAVPDAAEGMSASIRAGVLAIPEDHAVMILPADMPDITSDDLHLIAAMFQSGSGEQIVQGAGADMTPGHPVLFPPACRGDLLKCTGDTGARTVIAAHAHRLLRVSLPDNHALTDLDTPEAWAAYLANRPAQS
ncbi:nucleotidyltransferase family protein [Pseudaestuariivita atlantica]|uniref:MobA-like NTP transferase domain-containing protein n=1 Tax=Pseudaestuariivita atlantica TaxID=1317121 RepID=A0A0L1JVY5_9RHOB|nr:nucleotidyltransferase family protein [Pseudaestuariivita atlantica]KNG95558.1 hypothetical protein ATO11_02925 [Pseudaestuariivita atlantica]